MKWHPHVINVLLNAVWVYPFKEWSLACRPSEAQYNLWIKTQTPCECTIHFGTPVVPDENIMVSGWLNGSCSNVSGVASNSLGLESIKSHSKILLATSLMDSLVSSSRNGTITTCSIDDMPLTISCSFSLWL